MKKNLTELVFILDRSGKLSSKFWVPFVPDTNVGTDDFSAQRRRSFCDMQRLITVEGYGQICMSSTFGNLAGIRIDAAWQVYGQHKGTALVQTAYQPAGSKTGRPKCTTEPGAIESIANGYHKKITHRPSAGDGRKVCRKTRINYHRFHKRVT